MVREALGPEKKEVFVSEVDQQSRPGTCISYLGGKSSCRASKYTDVLNNKDGCIIFFDNVQAFLCFANINIKFSMTFGFKFFSSTS